MGKFIYDALVRVDFDDRLLFAGRSVRGAGADRVRVRDHRPQYSRGNS